MVVHFSRWIGHNSSDDSSSSDDNNRTEATSPHQVVYRSPAADLRAVTRRDRHRAQRAEIRSRFLCCGHNPARCCNDLVPWLLLLLLLMLPLPFCAKSQSNWKAETFGFSRLIECACACVSACVSRPRQRWRLLHGLACAGAEFLGSRH